MYPDSTLLFRRLQDLVKIGPDLIQIISWNGLSVLCFLTNYKIGESRIILAHYAIMRASQKVRKGGSLASTMNHGVKSSNILSRLIKLVGVFLKLLYIVSLLILLIKG